MLFVPKDPAKGKPAMVVEPKWDKNAQGAIQQIKDKQYPALLKDWHDKILLVGINDDKDIKAYECMIEVME